MNVTYFPLFFPLSQTSFTLNLSGMKVNNIHSLFWEQAVLLLKVIEQSAALEALFQIPGNFAGSGQPCKLAAIWKIGVMFCIGLHWEIATHSEQSSLALRSQELHLTTFL